MDFREATVIAKQNPGYVVTKAGDGSFVVRSKQGQIITTENGELPLRQRESENREEKEQEGEPEKWWQEEWQERQGQTQEQKQEHRQKLEQEERQERDTYLEGREKYYISLTPEQLDKHWDVMTVQGLEADEYALLKRISKIKGIIPANFGDGSSHQGSHQDGQGRSKCPCNGDSENCPFCYGKGYLV